jgi:hypothetical protein
MRDKKLLRIVSGFRDGILQGRSSAYMCYAICAPLQGFLSLARVHTSLVHGWIDLGDHNVDHVWLEMEDGRVIDPTADQFPLSLPPVYLGQLPTQYNVNDPC